MKEKISKTHRKEFLLGIILSFIFFLIVSTITFFAYGNSIKTKEYEKMDIISDNVTTIVERNFKEVFTLSRTLFYSESFQEDANIDESDPLTYVNNLDTHLVNSLSNLNVSIISGFGFIPYSNEHSEYVFDQKIYEGRFDGLFSISSTRSTAYYKQIANQSLARNDGTIFIIDQIEPEEEFIIFARLVKQTFALPLKQILGCAIIVVGRSDFLRPLNLYQSLDGMDGYIVNSESQRIFTKGKIINPTDKRYRVMSQYIDFYDYKIVSFYDTSYIYKDVFKTIKIQFFSFLGLFILFILIYYLIQKNYRKNLNYLFNSFQLSTQSKNIEYIDLTNQNTEVDQVIQAYNNMVTAILHEKKNNDILSEQNLKFEMKNLTTQINKHFVINILSVIHSLINLKESDKAKYCIEVLSDFLHYTLSLDKQEVDLNSEIVQIHNYVSLQLIRYKDIKVNYHINQNLLSIIVPKMILQPLVENAFIHGIPNKQGEIDIDVYKENNDIYLSVSNDGVITDAELNIINQRISRFERSDNHSSSNHGLALSNIAKRLQLRFGEQAKLSLTCDGKKVYSIIKIKKGSEYL